MDGGAKPSAAEPGALFPDPNGGGGTPYKKREDEDEKKTFPRASEGDMIHRVNWREEGL